MRLKNIWMALAPATLTLGATIGAAAEGEVFIEQGQRSAPSETITESRTTLAPQLGERAPRKARATAQAVNQDFWIYDARTRLLFDNDGDGYFTRLELDFDADTVFADADVYAVIFLSLNQGPWEELTTTAVFSIFGADSADEYFVDADLLSGYPSGSYDVLIELYDTFDGAFVAEFGPADSNELFDLPMEDQQIDAVIIGGPVVGIRQGGGGAAGLALMGALLAIGFIRRRTSRWT